MKPGIRANRQNIKFPVLTLHKGQRLNNNFSCQGSIVCVSVQSHLISIYGQQTDNWAYEEDKNVTIRANMCK